VVSCQVGRLVTIGSYVISFLVAGSGPHPCNQLSPLSMEYVRAHDLEKNKQGSVTKHP
jgi:hypothetical protein